MPDEPVHFASTAAAVVPESEGSGEAARADASKYARGEVLGDYVVESFIAEGGFGSVYRAKHPQFGMVALKVSHLPATKISTDRLALQQNELEALQQLRHPSLVRVLAHGSLPDQRYYLALELIEGESLHHYMQRRGRVDVIEAISLVRRLAEGIAHCHNYQILHLDLTPRNVIVVDPLGPDIKIVDFGVAAFTENRLDIARRPAAGTPLYMAPEMVSDQAQIGPHCDVYALGIIFYELLTGRFPFTATRTWELFLEKVRGEVTPVTTHVPEIPEGIAEAVQALLHPDPGKRGFSAASLGLYLKEAYFDVLRGTNSSKSTRTSRPTEIDSQAVPLVGRDVELGDLLPRAQAALRREPDGGAGGLAVVITGDAGIGKSRLLAELTHRLHLSHFVTGYGRCREHGKLVSYASWRECLGQLRRVVGRAASPEGEAARHAIQELLADPAVSDLSALVPELEVATGAAATPAGPGDVGSKRVSQAVKRLVAAVCAHLPTALVLEDLHWADQGTLDILGALVSEPLPPGLLILCTARPEAELPSWPAFERIALAPLGESQSAALLRELTGDISAEVIAELTSAIPLLRMGNPLVDTQVILHLKREGMLAPDADGKIVLSERFDRDYAPPTSVSAVLERRLEHVTARAREVLGIASLIGRQFRVSELREVASPEIPAFEVDEAVRETAELSLCRSAGDECVFVHDVIREHLETTVPAERRPELHTRIARILQERGAPAATLAHHLDQAGERAAAAAQYVAGGVEADRVHDLVGSSRNLRRALAIFLELRATPARDRDLAHAVYEIARITCLLGKTHEPLEDLDRCRLALTAAPPDALAMLDSAYARVFYAQGVFDRAMDHSERSLAVVDPALSSYQCVPANMLGRALCASGHFGPSIEVLQRGCQMARDTGELAELAHSLGLMGTSLAFVGRLDESRAAIDESNRLAIQLDNPARRMGVCLYQTLHAEATCAWDEGLRTSASLLAQSEEYSMAGLYLYLGTMMAGRHHFHLGELHRARHLLKNSINFSNIFGIRTCKSWAYAYLGDLYFVEGQLEEAVRWYTSAHELAREGRGDGYGVPLALIGLAHSAALANATPTRVTTLAEDSFRAFEAASNIAGLSVGLARYLEALDFLGDNGDAYQAASARLDRLRDRLGFDAAQFWPAAPNSATAGEHKLPAAEYWRQRTRSGTVTTDSIKNQRTAGSSLLLSLSTIDDYVPGFVVRQTP